MEGMGDGGRGFGGVGGRREMTLWQRDPSMAVKYSYGSDICTPMAAQSLHPPTAATYSYASDITSHQRHNSEITLKPPLCQ